MSRVTESATGAGRALRWAEFEAWESKAADAGSGMTREQMTGAVMFDMWLNERYGAAPTQLDVSRLAVALSHVENRAMASPTEPGPQAWRDAHDIAAEYARLRALPGAACGDCSHDLDAHSTVGLSCASRGCLCPGFLTDRLEMA